MLKSNDGRWSQKIETIVPEAQVGVRLRMCWQDPANHEDKRKVCESGLIRDDEQFWEVADSMLKEHRFDCPKGWVALFTIISMTPEQMVELMESATSYEDWNAKCDQVKKAFGGYPNCWYDLIVAGNVAARVGASWVK
jgi:hypothetical protein